MVITASTTAAVPVSQKTAAIKTRRLKKADFELSFFFMVGTGFCVCGKSETATEILGEMLRPCQHLFPEVSFVGYQGRSASHHLINRRREDHSETEASLKKPALRILISKQRIFVII